MLDGFALLRKLRTRRPIWSPPAVRYSVRDVGASGNAWCGVRNGFSFPKDRGLRLHSRRGMGDRRRAHPHKLSA